MLMMISNYYNEYFDWWFVTAMIAIYTPLFVSVILFLIYLSSTVESQKSDLKWLKLASWIAIAVLILGFIWLTIYICFLYKYEFVYTGFGNYNAHYIKQPKKEYLIISGVVTILLSSIYVYTLVLTKRLLQNYQELEIGQNFDGETNKLISNKNFEE